MECPPPPPAHVLPAEDGPTVTLPAETARWLALRDLYADRTAACELDARGRLVACTVDVDACADARTAAEAALRIERARAQEWREIARSRPSPGFLIVVAGASLAIGAVAWEAIR